jgi:hypothetical protein
LKSEKNANNSQLGRFGAKWIPLIGPEYAAIIRPFRTLILVGSVGILVGLPSGIFWQSRVGHVPDLVGIFGAFAFSFPGIAFLTTGLVLQTRLSYKINRDLRAANLPTPSISPDLRNPSRFLYWSRHFGVTPEQVQEAGRQAAAVRSGSRERSALNSGELWDFRSKNRDAGGGGTDDESDSRTH